MFARLLRPRQPHPADRVGLADLERLYREYAPTMLKVARRMVGLVEADVVVQEVFVELLRNDELRGRFAGGSLNAWLCEITRRKALEHLRKIGRERPTDTEVEVEVAGTEPDLLARDVLERFVARHVPENQRAFFVARFVEQRTQVEAAALLGVARSTLEGWEHKITRALRRFVMEEEL